MGSKERLRELNIEYFELVEQNWKLARENSYSISVFNWKQRANTLYAKYKGLTALIRHLENKSRE